MQGSAKDAAALTPRTVKLEAMLLLSNFQELAIIPIDRRVEELRQA